MNSIIQENKPFKVFPIIYLKIRSNTTQNILCIVLNCIYCKMQFNTFLILVYIQTLKAMKNLRFCN